MREEGALLIGKCKAWNLEKGYGFGVMDDGGPDIFLHQSAINVADGFRSVSVGTPIQLTYTVRDGKPAGANVFAVGGGLLPGYSTRLEASQKMATAPMVSKRPGATGGTVKWFDASKGYGFLTSDSGVEIFVNIKDVENQIPLHKEEPVDFFLEPQPDGRERAMRVRSLNPQQHVVQPPVFAAPPAAAYGATYAAAPANYGYPPAAYAPYAVQPVMPHIPAMSAMPGQAFTGVCKWFNSLKGFGFITPTDGSVELYFKGQDLQGSSSLEQGEPVRYEAKHQDGKSWAVNVMSTRISPKRAAPISYDSDIYGSAGPMKQPKTQYAPAPSQRYEQPTPQPFAFDQYQKAVPQMAAYGAVPAQRGYEYETDPAAAYQQAVQYRQY